MSLRAIKKQQSNQNTFSSTRQQNLFRKYQTQNNQAKSSKSVPAFQSSANKCEKRVCGEREQHLIDLRQQSNLLGRLAHSNPEIRRNQSQKRQPLTLRRKSENDITTLIAQCRNNSLDGGAGGILNAQSEVCLKTISTHYYNNNNDDVVHNQHDNRSMSTTRSHKDLSQSYGSQFNSTISVLQTSTPRRMSESSLSSSAYSQQHQQQQANSVGATTSMTICGYEIIEERARFTVYKLRVENQNNCWLVLRRYTDFVRLKNKIEQAFPRINLTLPRKKIFGDNFNAVFLDNRVQGLQIFVNAVMAREELRSSKIVHEFFCLDEPPSYSESMEECRAIFEAQEETISLLKTQISSKNDLILNLQKKLRDELLEKEKLKEVLCTLPSKLCPNCSTKFNVDVNN